jgi:prolyl-tRNA synthetase
VTETAERLHGFSIEAGREILWDDRDESPGVKFTDAELLGMPWVLTVSPRSLAAGGIEVTERATGERATRSIEAVEALIAGT